MEINKSRFSSIERITEQYLSQRTTRDCKTDNSVSFDDLLKERLNVEANHGSTALRFTKHADERLMQRNIVLSDDQMKRLENGTRKASEKGIKESLILMDSLAFIVNTKNNTVITAMEQSGSDDNIYTNIDGAVVI